MVSITDPTTSVIGDNTGLKEDWTTSEYIIYMYTAYILVLQHYIYIYIHTYIYIYIYLHIYITTKAEVERVNQETHG